MLEEPFSKRFLLAVLLTLVAINIFAQTDPSLQLKPSASISGTWVFTSQLTVGTDNAKIELDEEGGAITGQYFGLLGLRKLVSGTVSGDQVTLTVEGELPTNGASVQATLIGVLSATSGSGSLSISQQPAGTWTSRRPRPHEDLEPRAKVTVDYRSERAGASRKITFEDLPKPGFALTLANRPKIIPRLPDTKPRAPEGFRVSLYTDGFDYPRKIQTAPNGDIFLTESHTGEIKILRGVGPDGKTATVSTFATGLTQPFGIAFYPPGPAPSYVYVANTGSVVRFPYINGDLRARGDPEVVISDIPAGGMLVGGGHWTRDLAFSKDGGELFVSVGSWSEDEDSPKEVRRADVLEYTPDGQFIRIYASGVRNPVGIAIDPNSGQLWCTTNERDMEGNDLVPDFITHLEQSGFYGWPWFYIGNHYDPRHQGEHHELLGKVISPDVLLQAHTAPLAMTFYSSCQFPDEYQGDIFAAAHGSWNRAIPAGYEVVRVHLRNGIADGEYEDFLTGFITEQGEVWGRPVGVTVAQDGSLLVSDDVSKTVWRVTYDDERLLRAP